MQNWPVIISPSYLFDHMMLNPAKTFVIPNDSFGNVCWGD